MSPSVLILGLLIIVSWGTWGFLAKVAQERIGPQVLIWYLLASNILLFGYLLATQQLWPLRLDTSGVAFGLAVGVTASLGTILFYLLLASAPTSLIIPLTALYPAVTALLGIWLLHEPFTINRVVGVALAVMAIFFLSR